MLAFVGHCLAIEQPAQNLHGLTKPGLADRRWVELLSNGLILGERVPRSDPDLQAATAEVVQVGQLLGQMDGG